MSLTVITAVIGGYESLREQPVAAVSDARFVCYTDDPDLASETWEVRQIDPFWPGDPVRSARRVKILSHAYLDDDEDSLWIDNSIELKRRPEDLFAHLIGRGLVGMFWHSHRDCLDSEFSVVSRQSLDSCARVSEQREYYRSVVPELLEIRPYWTAIVARRGRSSAVHQAMEIWYAHVQRFSRRDQLSVGPALAGLAERLVLTEGDNFSSPWHEWRVGSRKAGVRRGGYFRYTLWNHLIDDVIARAYRSATCRRVVRRGRSLVTRLARQRDA